jgi:hypothetical protein
LPHCVSVAQASEHSDVLAWLHENKA